MDYTIFAIATGLTLAFAFLMLIHEMGFLPVNISQRGDTSLRPGSVKLLLALASIVAVSICLYIR